MADKVAKVMHEFKKGTLRSGGDGKVVTNRKQAIAIGMSEAGKSRSKKASTGLKGAMKRRLKR